MTRIKKKIVSTSAFKCPSPNPHALWLFHWKGEEPIVDFLLLFFSSLLSGRIRNSRATLDLDEFESYLLGVKAADANLRGVADEWFELATRLSNDEQYVNDVSKVQLENALLVCGNTAQPFLV